ncbi:hypothetical protein SAMN05421688_3090 [Poseidonocella pacifica]|uniref:Twin-arginine translocation pathway signal n=1 Tax=Poseidonocella pacifica TaxID=871651 RepID=A0A1I0YKG5_9RHOB|nr:DUF1513 domain-containing protein [Poseidonocella pacifica]SFB12653.1 hypothetical protein SAMN05421688_3090 [Poseidonocella pacifica]
MTTRRGFLASLAAAATLPRASWADMGAPAFLGVARVASGAYSLYGLDAEGSDLFAIPLPARGHAAAAHPTAPEAVVFARRPGRFALVLDCATGGVTHRLDAPPGRHFYGHGAFIAEGQILCTTENHIDSGEGRIGLWSRAEGWRRIGEFATGGIGPHDLKRLDGDVLVVANGGIRTHPDHGRDKLNLETMRPSLAYVDPDGALLDQVELPSALHQNSIRHLAVGRSGTVAFAMQWQGAPTDAIPLLGIHRRGTTPVLGKAPPEELRAMKGYAGSIAIDAGGRIAITSPRGGRVQTFGADGAFLDAYERADVCGVASHGAGFVISDGLGGLSFLLEAPVALRRAADRAWDNHLVPLV